VAAGRAVLRGDRMLGRQDAGSGVVEGGQLGTRLRRHQEKREEGWRRNVSHAKGARRRGRIPCSVARACWPDADMTHWAWALSEGAGGGWR